MVKSKRVAGPVASRVFLLQPLVSIFHLHNFNTPICRILPKDTKPPPPATMTVTQSVPAAEPTTQSAPETTTSFPNTEEYQYLDLCREIIDQGELRQDRYAAPPSPLLSLITR